MAAGAHRAGRTDSRPTNPRFASPPIEKIRGRCVDSMAPEGDLRHGFMLRHYTDAHTTCQGLPERRPWSHSSTGRRNRGGVGHRRLGARRRAERGVPGRPSARGLRLKSTESASGQGMKTTFVAPAAHAVSSLMASKPTLYWPLASISVCTQFCMIDGLKAG